MKAMSHETGSISKGRQKDLKRVKSVLLGDEERDVLMKARKTRWKFPN